MYSSLLTWKRSKPVLIYRSCRFYSTYAKVIFSIITITYIFEFHRSCAIWFSERKIYCSCAILFSKGKIKSRKGFFPAFSSIWKFSAKKSCAASGKQVNIKVTQYTIQVSKPWENLKFSKKHIKLPKKMVKPHFPYIYIHFLTFYYHILPSCFSYWLKQFCNNCLSLYSAILFMLMSFSKLI